MEDRTSSNNPFEDGTAAFGGSSTPWVAGDLVSSKEPLRKTLYKVRDLPGQEASGRKTQESGKVLHPFNMELADSMIEVSPYHGSCQATLVSATVGCGLGVIDEEATTQAKAGLAQSSTADAAGKLPVIDHERTEELYDTLDSMCEHDFDHLMTQVAGNYWGVGNAYMECGRDSDDQVSSLYWLPAPDVYRTHYLDKRRDRFYFTLFNGYNDGEVLFARWRKMQELRAADEVSLERQEILNEVVDFTRPTTRWEGYGAPHWLAAVPYMDVDVRALQRVSDYMFNGGMPQNMLFLGGMPINGEQLLKMREVMSGASGSRQGQSALFTMPSSSKDRAWVEHIKVGDSVEGTGFQDMHGTINLSVASANQVPPVLAGITTPGKMGAANEMAQAIMTMQSNVISPVQNYLAKRLNRTLFSTIGGIRGFAGTKVRFKTWHEAMDMAALNTVARQREQVAAAPDRDPDEGLRR